MPTEVLNQLRSLREGIAETLRKDPRYLTLNALDKSIAEISGVLSASGLLPAGAAPPAPVHFDATPAGAAASSATPAAPPAAAPIEAPSVATSVVATPSEAGAATAAPAAGAPAEAPKKKKKKSIVKPMAEAAALLVAGGIAAEVVHAKSKAAAAPKHDADAAGESEPTDEDPGQDEHAGHGETHDHADSGDDAEAGDENTGRAESAEAADGGEEAADHADGEDPDGGPDARTEAHPDADSVIPKGKASGYKAMAAKPGAPQYQPSIAVKFGKLPNKVDLRPLMTPIEDQGQTSSCVANAVAGAYEYWIKKASKQDQNISRLFIYYNARWRDGSQDKDDGSVIQLAMEGLSKFGACPETVWPFDPHLILKKPGAEAYKDGAPYKVQDMAQVPLKLDAWKQALAEGKPIVFGCELFDSFDECTKKGGVVPMPAPDDIARKKHSGHSMCAVGYSDTEKVFIVRNSWGTDFGDKGYCYMPYDYLMSSKFNDGDCWVFVPKVPMQPPREVWIDNTDPVTNDGKGVDFEISPYTIADYQAVAIDLFEKVRHPFNTVVEQGYSEYVSFAEQSLYSRMEQFDFKTFLASTAALAGVAVAAESISSEFSETNTSTETVAALSEEHSDEDDDASDDDQDGDDDAEDGDDDAEDGDEDAEDGDDEAEDGDDDAEDGDDDAEDGDDDAEDGDDDAEDGDDDAEDGDDDAEDGDDDAEDGDDDAEDGDDDAEDGDDEEGGDDDGGDDD